MAFTINGATLDRLSVHNVGNKSADDYIVLTKEEAELYPEIENLLRTYFIKPFKLDEFFSFFHDSDVNLNEVYVYVSSIFENPDSLHEQSINLAKHLYSKCNHPKIKGGEFYVAYFSDCTVDGIGCNAVGIFKSESKETFLKVSPNGDVFEFEPHVGININKLDKGCIVFNAQREDGYVVALVDNTNKSVEARYWTDEFLNVQQRKDNYYKTQNVLSMCKTFVSEELPRHFEVSKADQADLLNKSVAYFKENESFTFDEFTGEVLSHPEVVETFNSFRESYQQSRDVVIDDSFEISDSAVRKQSRGMKSVIKLDKNFHIYVHGDKNRIVKGYDPETGLNFYQLFFDNEE